MGLNEECLTFLSGLPKQGQAPLPKEKKGHKNVQVCLHPQVQNKLIIATDMSSAFWLRVDLY